MFWALLPQVVPTSLISGLCKNFKAGYAPAQLHGEVDQVVNIQNYITPEASPRKFTRKYTNPVIARLTQRLSPRCTLCYDGQVKFF